MQAFIFTLVLSVLFLGTVESAFCSGKPDDGERTSDYPIQDSDLVFLRSVDGAELWEAGPPNARFPVVHLWGSDYEMGLAHGKLMKKEIHHFINGVWEWAINSGLDELGDKLPKWAQEIVLKKGIARALDWTARVTAPFTPQSYFDEVRGLADGAGIDYDLLLKTNMIPELTKASCSFFGAWGAATKDSTGNAYQLRALDYITDVDVFSNMNQITIYHPSAEGDVAHMSVTWPGIVGVLTAFSEEQIALSEIGVSDPDDSFGQGTENTPPEKVHGQPWMSVLKDIVAHDHSLEDALSRIENANRTCNLIIGVGDGEENYVNGVEYSGRVAVPYDDKTLLPQNDTWHPKIDNVVYNGMDWNCPGYTEVLGEQLQKYHGAIDASVTIKNILPTVQTGDLHAMVTDLTDSTVFVSFIRPTTNDPSEPQYAYQRQFTMFKMAPLFAKEQTN